MSNKSKQSYSEAYYPQGERHLNFSTNIKGNENYGSEHNMSNKAVVVLGYNENNRNFDKVIRDRAKTGADVAFEEFVDKKLTPFIINSGTPKEITRLETEERKITRKSYSLDYHSAQFSQTYANNTLENAMITKGLLREKGIKTAYLVTSPDHMDRAYDLFRSATYDITFIKKPGEVNYQDKMGRTDEDKARSSDLNYRSKKIDQLKELTKDYISPRQSEMNSSVVPDAKIV